MQSIGSTQPPAACLLRSLAAVLVVPALLLWLTTDPLPRPPVPHRPAATIEAFQSPEPERVRKALARLRRVQPPPVDWLLEQLRHPNRGVREWSAHALGDLAPARDRVVRALMVAFEDEDDYVRWKAARALGRIGPRAAIALPMLRPVAASDQEVEVVRATARRAIEQITGAPPD